MIDPSMSEIEYLINQMDLTKREMSVVLGVVRILLAIKKIKV